MEIKPIVWSDCCGHAANFERIDAMEHEPYTHQPHRSGVPGAVNVFENQRSLRVRSWLMVILFLIALVLNVTAIYGAAVIVVLFMHDDGLRRSILSSHTFGWYLAIASEIILAVSLVSILRLRRRGGVGLMEKIGARRVPFQTKDPFQRRLLNIVDEIAIAARHPVPGVWILSGNDINALTAGFGEDDRVLAVTEGALKGLRRDELQAIVAHEFGHMLNGDTRMKMDMMGLLRGLDGFYQVILKLMSDSSLALTLIFGSVAWIGKVLSEGISALVLIEREYLADATAVQLTRNPAGLISALKTIGGWPQDTDVQRPAAKKLPSYFFFCSTKKWGLPQHRH